MNNSKIEWTDHTFNPWWGCMKVSEGCKNCYAQNLDNRYHHDSPHWGPGSRRKLQSEAYWKQPFKWNADAAKAGVRAKVFCASMADVFEAHGDTYYERMRLFTVIMETPWLDWQLLTKRPENIMTTIPRHWCQGFPENVWIGTSVENQKAANERIPHLLKVPAKVRFLSCEPLLGPVDLFNVAAPPDPDQLEEKYFFDALNVNGGYVWEFEPGRFDSVDGPTHPGIQWVITGGESGHGARPMHPDWVRGLRDQCADAGVPFFFKQWGEYVSVSEVAGYGSHHLFEDGATVRKLGKKATGRLLDGKEYNQFPA